MLRKHGKIIKSREVDLIINKLEEHK